MARPKGMPRVAKGNAGVPHIHGCTSCHDRYEDTCSLPNSNGKCLDCSTGRPTRWFLLMVSRWPHPCCFTDSRLARKEEVDRYKLSKGCQWFVCNKCKRNFPYRNPTSIAVEERFNACCLYAVRPVDPIIRHRLKLADDVAFVCVLCGAPQHQ